MFIRGGLKYFLINACVSIVFLSFTLTASAQSAIDYKVHANVIYRFTKYIEWPEDKQEGDFIIVEELI